ncbi:hypothetical protein MMC17_009964 [Xylographa soralifera]|nr:hypothetical protein [Xylographa soralifera]
MGDNASSDEGLLLATSSSFPLGPAPLIAATSSTPVGNIVSVVTVANSVTTYITFVTEPMFTTVSSASGILPIVFVLPSSATSTTAISALASTLITQSPPSSTTAEPSVLATAQPSNSLSTGAKAGIGIGATAGAIFLMLLGAFFSSINRWRRRKEDNQAYDRVEPESYVQRQMSRKELDGNNVLGRSLSRIELDGTHWKRELEGDTPKGFDTKQL